MKICLISPTYPRVRCGIADYTYALKKALEEKGLVVHVITSKREAVLHQEDIFPVIKKWNIKGLLTVVNKLKEIEPDIVHIQYEIQAFGRFNVINLLPIFIKILSDKKVAVTVHELGDVTYWFPSLYGKLSFYIKCLQLPFTRFMLRYSDFIIVTNEDAQNALKKFKFSCELIYMGSPFLKKSNAVASRNLKVVSSDDTRFKFAWLGLIREEKGLEVLFEAINKIKDKNFIVYIIGDIDEGLSTLPYIERLKNIISEEKIEDKIRWTGYFNAYDYSNTMNAMIENIDAFVFPYNSGISFKRISLISAVNMGKPVIATKNKDIDELKNRENILFIKTNSPDDLAVAMTELILNEKLRRKLTEGSIELSKLFLWPEIAKKHRDAYNKITKKTTSSAVWDVSWSGISRQYQQPHKKIITAMEKNIKLKGKIMLEIGAGSGLTSLELANREAYTVTLDSSRESIKVMRDNDKGKVLKIVQGDALNLPFKEVVFDVVFHQGLLEHFKNPNEIIKEQARVLKNKGIFLVDVPQKFNTYTLMKHMLIKRGKWYAGWETEYSIFALKKMIRSIKDYRLKIKTSFGYGTWGIFNKIRFIHYRGNMRFGRPILPKFIFNIYEVIWQKIENSFIMKLIGVSICVIGIKDEKRL